VSALESWLDRYGRAWEAKDTTAFVGLFAAEASYHWTPYREPQRGRAELATAFEAAIARQRSIVFTHTIWSSSPAVCHWHCEFLRVPGDHRVKLDGVFHMTFDGDGLCTEFREWWHSDEFDHEEKQNHAETQRHAEAQSSNTETQL
jgi:hypothetical protein